MTKNIFIPVKIIDIVPVNYFSRSWDIIKYEITKYSLIKNSIIGQLIKLKGGNIPCLIQNFSD